MKNTFLLAATLLMFGTSFAQWEFYLAGGFGYTILIPAPGLRRHSSNVHYGPSKPGIFLSPSLALRVGEKETFSLGYQLASNFIGVRIAPPGIGKGRDYMRDGVTTHQFYIGFEHTEPMARGRLKTGLMARAGLAYGQMVSMSAASRSGMSSHGLAYSGSTRVTDFDVMPDFWAPTCTLGLSVAPVLEGKSVGDRFKFTLTGTLIARNPYASPSVAEYTMVSPTVTETGSVSLSGMPVQMQVGVDYKLFPHIRHSEK